MMGGGVGIADHVTIGAGAQLAAGSGFMHDVPAGEVWGGYPAEPMAATMRGDRDAAQARGRCRSKRG